MNVPEGNKTFAPKQALAPTPGLYEELVGDTMDQLAVATLAEIDLGSQDVLYHDVGCGTGPATRAVVERHSVKGLRVIATDNVEAALKTYRTHAADEHWPAEAKLMDATNQTFPDNYFTHIVGNALIFTLPNDGIEAVKETYRTLRPGGVAAFNSWAYNPNLGAIQAAAKATRPKGTPSLRAGGDKWEDPALLARVAELGGFPKDAIELRTAGVSITTVTTSDRYFNMLWSFTGGTGAAGWLESDEDNWDKALQVLKEEVSKTNGYQELADGHIKLKFLVNIVILRKPE